MQFHGQVPDTQTNTRFDPLDVQLYPNPTTGEVAVQPHVPTRYQWVKVRNLLGRVLLEQQATPEAGITTFDVRELPAGLYEVQLFDGEKLTTQRLQKN